MSAYTLHRQTKHSTDIKPQSDDHDDDASNDNPTKTTALTDNDGDGNNGSTSALQATRIEKGITSLWTATH